MKTTYRDFEIEYDTLVGQFMYKHVDYDGPEDKRLGMCNTERECKEEIDEWYLINTTYVVEHSRVLTPMPFDYYAEAKQFCKYWGISLDSITPRLCGFEFQFNAP